MKKKNRKEYSYNEMGYSFILVLLLLILTSVIGIGLITLATNTLKITNHERTDQAIYYIAEAGLTIKRTDLLDELDAIIDATKTEYESYLQNKPPGVKKTISSIFNEHFKRVEQSLLQSNSYSHFEKHFGEVPSAEVTPSKSGNGTKDDPITIELKSTGKIGVSSTARTILQKITISHLLTSDEAEGEGSGILPNNFAVNTKTLGIFLESKSTFVNGGMASEQASLDNSSIANLGSGYNGADLSKLNVGVAYQPFIWTLPDFPEKNYDFTPNSTINVKYPPPVVITTSWGSKIDVIDKNGNLNINNSMAGQLENPKAYTYLVNDDIQFKNFNVNVSDFTFNLNVDNSSKDINLYFDNLNIKDSKFNINLMGTKTVNIYMKQLKIENSKPSNLNFSNANNIELFADKIAVTNSTLNFNDSKINNIYTNDFSITGSTLNYNGSKNTNINTNLLSTTNAILNFSNSGNSKVYSNSFTSKQTDINIKSNHLDLYVKDSFTPDNIYFNKNGSSEQLSFFYEGKNKLTFAQSIDFVGSLYAKEADLIFTSSAKISGAIMTGGTNISLRGGSHTKPLVFLAPNADFKLSEGAKVYGPIYVNSFSATGGSFVDIGNNGQFPDIDFGDNNKPVINWDSLLNTDVYIEINN